MSTQLAPERRQVTDSQADSVSRQPALLKWFFRVPVGLYRLGLADQLGPSTLLLTTRGRKTGRRRTTALNYVVDSGVTYVLAGMGPCSDWLRNLRADPYVQVQIGRQRFDALAEVIVDPAEHRRILCLWAQQSRQSAPPAAVQAVMRRLGFDYDASIRKHLEEDPPPPIVALRVRDR
jgi:deazaflavin-dependent oxidoreductase (nitroreductase family)